MGPLILNTDALTNLRQSRQAQEPADLLPYVQRHFEIMLARESADWNLSIYDLAWVLCADYMGEGQRASSLEVLRAVQKADGSWGDSTHMPHSALVDTLAVVMAFIRLGMPVPRPEYVRFRIDALITETRHYPRHDTVAFELLMPLLITWIEAHDFDIPLAADSREYVEKMLKKGQYKLSLVAAGPGLFNRETTLSYTAEFAALIPLTDADLDQLPGLILPNGAVGLSPAATAATIMVLREHGRDVPPKLYKYLEDVFSAYGHKGFPDLYPYAHTQRLWNLVPWILSGSIFDLMTDAKTGQMMHRMYQDLAFDAQGRVSWDTYNTDLPDLDDTSVAYALGAVLLHAGYQLPYYQPLSAFRAFQREDKTFFCYPAELHPSPVGILHALMALQLASHAFGTAFSGDPEVRSLTGDLLANLNPGEQSFDEMWHDKWHASWTYGAQRWLSIQRIRQAYPEAVVAMVAEILRRQENGGWGQQASSLEETAYTAAGLTAVLTDYSFVLPVALRRAGLAALGSAQEFMREEMDKERFDTPLIWISKNVYIPLHQAISAIFDAYYSLMHVAKGAPARVRVPVRLSTALLTPPNSLNAGS